MGGKNAHELVLLDQAGQALAEAQSLDEIKLIRDKAEAVRKYAQSASLGLDVQNRAAEVKLRAERQAGRLLAQLMLRGGDRRSKVHSDRLKLIDLGLTTNQSKRWQLQARVPENVFREHVKQTCEDGRELTSAGVMRLAKRLKGEPVGHEARANGRGTATSHRRRDSNRFSEASADEPGWRDSVGESGLGELVSELQNHHKVLAGILGPLCQGETPTLRPAELRMLRYLIGEMDSILTRVSALPRQDAACMCHNDRVAS